MAMPCLFFLFTSLLWVRVGGVVSASFGYVSFITWFPFSFLGCPTVLLSTASQLTVCVAGYCFLYVEAKLLLALVHAFRPFWIFPSPCFAVVLYHAGDDDLHDIKSDPPLLSSPFNPDPLYQRENKT